MTIDWQAGPRMIRRLFPGALLGMAVLVGTAHAAPFTPAARAETLDHIAQLIGDHYVYKDVAARLATEVRGWKADPELARARDERAYASRLTDRLSRSSS